MCVGLHLTPRQSTCWGQMQGHSLHDVRDMLCKEKCQSSEPLLLTCIKVQALSCVQPHRRCHRSQLKQLVITKMSVKWNILLEVVN